MEAKTKSRSRNTGPSHLAVVDDNSSIHAAVREHLQQAGELWQVSVYHNGRGALKAMADGPPDAMLMQTDPVRRLRPGMGWAFEKAPPGLAGGYTHHEVLSREVAEGPQH